MKKLFVVALTFFVVSLTFGQTKSNSNVKKDTYKSPNFEGLYGTNSKGNNADAGQSGYGYGNRTNSKAYDDRKVNGSEKDNVHPSVREQQRKTMEYNAAPSEKKSTGVDIKRVKSKDDK
jgi:hypothetical protein